ncbi:hypothetical protein Pcinc_024892 [Petrolisthes cinctipes]|uniref:Uncharacterized protein n=1 Tax=Petrolisthes cinctipes TaxID=88211 RepID=A0AAE1KCD9_PETCI|nr:hypothetical protein Pcinc_024892 [Petrolisthes cinctipes]
MRCFSAVLVCGSAGRHNSTDMYSSSTRCIPSTTTTTTTPTTTPSTTTTTPPSIPGTRFKWPRPLVAEPTRKITTRNNTIYNTYNVDPDKSRTFKWPPPPRSRTHTR